MMQNIKNIKRSSRNRGAAIITAVLLLVVVSATIAIGMSSPVLREYNAKRDFTKAKEAYYLSEAGQEDVMYRIKNAKPVSDVETLTLGGNSAVTTVATMSATEKVISSIANVFSNFRRSGATLSKVSGVSFFYGMQVGVNGLTLNDDAVINGNVYSNGNVTGDSTAGDDDAINGDLVVAGTSDILNGYVNGTAYADAITGSYIRDDAYNRTIATSVVAGTNYSGVANQPTTSFVITSEMITLWETAAAAGGTTTCSESTYNITGSVTLGPRKFARSGSDPCTLVVGSGDILTLAGPIWVKGGITINGTGQVKVSPTLDGQSVALISDNSSDYNEGNRVRVEDNVTFTGYGANSYIMLISMGRSTVEAAIDMWDNVSGAILAFAPDGQINIRGNTHVKEVSAKKVSLSGTAALDYDTGLESLLFNSGTMGTWEVQDWKSGQ